MDSTPPENENPAPATAATAIPTLVEAGVAEPPSLQEPIASSSSPTQTIEVYTPPPDASSVHTPSEVDDTFFTPTLSDVQAHHASVLARSRRLNEAPLLTSKHRDEDKAARDRRKAERWPETTIRVKFSDGTQIQSIFPSTSPIQPVYAFVRSALAPAAALKPFILWQPPKTQYPEHPLPAPKKPHAHHKTPIIPPANYGPVRGSLTPGLQSGTGGRETLNELGLVPQSVLLVRWEDEAMNASGYPAPILDELKAKSVPLPPHAPKAQAGPSESKSTVVAPTPTGEKKIPKWLQKGLMKKK